MRRISNGSIWSNFARSSMAGLDRERRLRRTVTAKTAARHHVGVDRITDCFLVGAAIGRHWAAERCRQRLATVTAIRARVGDHVDLDRGQDPIRFGPELYPGGHLMARRCTDELLLASELPFHRPAGLHGGEQA